MLAMGNQEKAIGFAGAAMKKRRPWSLDAALVLAMVGLFGGCDNATFADSPAALISGLPKCDPSLLHPRITVGATTSLPGKLIVYVDGVAACVDEANRVDQIMPQIEGYAVPSATRPTLQP